MFIASPTGLPLFTSPSHQILTELGYNNEKIRTD